MKIVQTPHALASWSVNFSLEKHYVELRRYHLLQQCGASISRYILQALEGGITVPLESFLDEVSEKLKLHAAEAGGICGVRSVLL
ncbi:MAG: hypothetical protein C5B55_14340 [Blastocatellia bacterium]|nr:MAG: hypothetical protein C5B55_14340 [Blastocatellia bacterium]